MGKQGQEVFDVCVVGSGAAGGVVAMQLAQAGANVVVLEAGKWVDPATDFHGHVMPYDLPKHGSGWNATRHLRVDPELEPFTQTGNQPVDYFVTKAVGGKSLLWAGLSWRNSNHDFAAWPVNHDQLSPYYDRMEELMGVTGNLDHHPNVPDGKFLKPLAWNCGAYEIRKGLRKLDPDKYRMITARKAILTEKHKSGRPPCHYCGFCMRGCDTESKYTSANGAMAIAMKTGKCKLVLYANAAELMVSKDGHTVTGVRYFDARTKTSSEVLAKYTVLACGPIESARLLLLSKSRHFPTGLANSSGLVGRNLISHTVASAHGYLPQLKGSQVYNDDGTDSGHAYIASWHWQRPNPNFSKGYHIIIDSGAKLGSYGYWMAGATPGFGGSLKKEILARYPALINLYSQNGMISSPDRYMDLDPKVKDTYGLPVAKIHFNLTSEDRASFKDASEHIAEIIHSAGGVILGQQNTPGVDSVHWAGTARMGRDKKTSVLTPYLQTHDVPNLFVADGSGFVDFAEKNPTLTVMALASRCADYIRERLAKS